MYEYVNDPKNIVVNFEESLYKKSFYVDNLNNSFYYGKDLQIVEKIVKGNY